MLRPIPCAEDGPFGYVGSPSDGAAAELHSF
jgi:hypothetical protein